MHHVFTNKKDGAAMGSPVSAVIANLYMEELEEGAIATATYKPKIWKRYVDGTFTILGKDYVDGFLQHLNSQQPRIRFTMEIEKTSRRLMQLKRRDQQLKVIPS